jgi:hypothetical protein
MFGKLILKTRKINKINQSKCFPPCQGIRIPFCKLNGTKTLMKKKMLNSFILAELKII